MKHKAPQVDCEHCAAKEAGIFGNLDLSNINCLSQNKTCTRYKKNQVIFHEGTRPQGVYHIHSGRIKIFKTGVEGKDQIIQILKSGDLMGYRAMLSDEQYPVSAETLEEAVLCFIPRSDFMEALSTDPKMAQSIIKSLSKDLGNMADHLTTLAQKPVRERLAGALTMLIDTYDLDAIEGASDGINLTREDLANIVGTATETLIRLLHDFKEEELIETQGRKIYIKNKTKLERVANLA